MQQLLHQHQPLQNHYQSICNCLLYQYYLICNHYHQYVTDIVSIATNKQTLLQQYQPIPISTPCSHYQSICNCFCTNTTQYATVIILILTNMQVQPWLAVPILPNKKPLLYQYLSTYDTIVDVIIIARFCNGVQNLSIYSSSQ